VSTILERYGISANRPLPRNLAPATITRDKDGNVSDIRVDDRTLAKILGSLQLDIFKVAQALGQFAVTMGTLDERSDAEGTGEMYLNEDDQLIYYDAPAKVNDPAPSYAWRPIAYITSDGQTPLTGPWDAGFGITTDYIQLDVTYADGSHEGRIQWNADDGTPECGMPGGDVNLQIGQELLVRVKNASGSTIPNGAVVTLSGASGHRPEVDLADASDHTKSHSIAIATEEISNNQMGFCNIGAGMVRDVDTSAWAATTLLYLSATTPGALTSTQADAPNTNCAVGFVINSHANEGSIYFFPNVRPHLTELSDVHHTAFADTEFLRWVAASSRFEPGDITAADLAWYVWSTGDVSIAYYNKFNRLDLTTGPMTLDVASAVGHKGERVAYKKIDSSSNALTLNFIGGQNADGHTEIVIAFQNDSYTLVSDGTNWSIE